MKINRNNYEQYALDFLEGKLNPLENDSFKDFLENNKDIAVEIQNFAKNVPFLKPEKDLPDFSFLLQDINSLAIDESNFDEMCIAFYEGDLNENTKKRLLQFVHSDFAKQQKFELFGRLKLKADVSAVYKSKALLKHREGEIYSNRRIAIITSLAAAASIALFLLFRNPLQNLRINEVARTTIFQTETKKTQRIFPDETHLSPGSVVETEKIDNTIPIKNPRKHVQLAVIDSSSSNENDFIRISRIDAEPILQNTIDPYLSFKPEISYTIDTRRNPKILKKYKAKGFKLFEKASSLTVNDLIASSIKGINNIAETDLKYAAQTNDKGKIKTLELSSGNFNFSHQFRSN
jgi:hypothetical protein